MIPSVQQGAQSVFERVNLPQTTYKSRVLSEIPHARMVIQYNFYNDQRQPEPVLSVVGKFYSDETGCKTYQRMKRLQTALSKMSQPVILAIPQVLFYDPNRRFLVQQRVQGTPYPDLVRGSGSGRYFRLAGEALAALHSLNVSGGRRKWLCDHLKELIHPHPLELQEQLPQLSLFVEALIEMMRKEESEYTKKINGCPIHRDFHLRQLFYGERRVWLTDWDLFSKGDPALDVGNFLVYLETHLPQNSSASKSTFLEGYFRSRPSSILKRVFLYKALTYLRLACKQYRLKRNEKNVKEMLENSARCLEEKSS